jgi:hypothetical protein
MTINLQLMNRFSIFLIVSGLLPGACCDEDFIMPGDYDFIEYAMDVTNMVTPSTSCSAFEAYTTMGATPDGNAGDCWGASPAPRHNRWFKFIASASQSIFISINVGSTYGTQRRTYAALWDTNGTTQVGGTFEDPEDQGVYLFNSSALVQGQVYYFSVDVADADGRGTFSICMSDSD